jgi:putative ABC transport system permease protein
MDRWWEDIRLAWMGLTRARSFAAAAVVTLALGIAGVTLMFALTQGVLLRRWPVQDQARLVVAWKQLPTTGFEHYPFGDAEIEAVSTSSRLLERVAGVTRGGVSQWVAIENDTSTYLNGAVVTGSFFDVLGTRAVLGRALAPADDVEGAEPVITISDGLWRRRYGSSHDVIGHRLTLDEQSFTIVGVMPRDIDYPQGVEVWRPAKSVPANGPFGDAARREIDLIGRLRPGVTIAQVTSELDALTRRFEEEGRRDVPQGLVPIVRGFATTAVGDMRKPILILFGAVGLVLVIASANVANLLLMRSEARRREIAVRTALGAGRGRIVGQLLVESLLLALAAGVAGITLSAALLQPLMSVVPAELPRAESVRIDVAVVLFTVGVAFATSLLAGLVPALSSVRADVVSQLRSGGRGVTSSTARFGRRVLVVAQVALAVMILVAAGLLTHSLLKLQSVDIGLSADHLVLIDLALPQAKYADRATHERFLDEAMARLEGDADLSAATPVNVPPFAGIGGWDVPRFTAEGQDAERVASNPSLNLESIHPNYFKTFGIVLQRGRTFTRGDREGAPQVAIVSEDVARLTWPGEDPIGKRLKLGGVSSRDPWLTIVGVAAATRYRELSKLRPTLYLPAAQFQMTAEILAVRTTASIDRVARLAREALQQIDPTASVMRVEPFSKQLDRTLADRRFNMFLVSVFGLAALTLATIGLYAVMAASVRQRDREIGIRVAVGATPQRIRQLVLGEGLSLTGIGVAIGVVGAIAGARVIQSLLFETAALDPQMIVGAVVVLVVASLLASLVPVRRAMGLDAVSLLQSE